MASHDEVAHNWANKTGKCRNGFNMYYEGDTIYSYGSHFPIAKFETLPNGSEIILFTTQRYSVSTSKHLTITQRALGYSRDDILYVDKVEGSPIDNWKAALEPLNDLALKWKRARVYKRIHAGDMKSAIDTANRINKLWKLKKPAQTMPDDIAGFVADFEAQQIAERKAKDAKDREAIRDWVNGADIRPPHTRIPYVRVRTLSAFNRDHPKQFDEVTVVETSWGIKVPIKEALHLYKLSHSCRKSGLRFHPKNLLKVGGWVVEHITTDGTLKVGCHIIPFKVQHKAAQLAGYAR